MRVSDLILRSREAASRRMKPALPPKHGPNRGKFVIRVCGSICDDPSGIKSRDHHGAATPAKLRVLRQGPAAERCGGADLFLRMYVLCGLRREQAAQCVPELRRWVCAAADPARHRAA